MQESLQGLRMVKAFSLEDEMQRIVAPRHFQLSCKLHQDWCIGCKCTGQQHLPIVAGIDQLVQLRPRIRRKKMRHVGQGI